MNGVFVLPERVITLDIFPISVWMPVAVTTPLARPTGSWSPEDHAGQVARV
jgi:hypothetical protein